VSLKIITAGDNTGVLIIPLCVVEKKRVGFSARDSADWAPWSPSSTLCCKRAFRAVTIAISESAKTPFAAINRRTMRISVAISLN
jgi:hypothetical protein